ncbi:MAG TPA: heavy metal-associated domain-containing protein [Chitinophagales bacterium]|nr:heavy metal-associated domain-containing protein [Chitinophagales bacterium]
MKNVAFVLLLGIFGFSQANAQSTKEKVVIKTSAVCESCKNTIEKAVYQVDGVRSVYLDVETQMATVKFDGTVTHVDAIKKAISQAGYDADELPADKNAYDNLTTCCKKDAVH